MIQPNELRIGNWVKMNKSGIHFQIKGVDSADVEDVCSSIPLTPEILEKCGFVKEVKKSGSITSPDFGVYTLEPLVYNTNNGWWLYRNNIQDSPSAPKRLHQLQNLFYCLTGAELNYKP